MENGCKWRSLPKEYGNWHVIYVRISRWAKKGILERAFLRLQQLGIIQIQANVVSLDSTCIKVHPDGMGAQKKTEPKPSEKHEAGGTPEGDETRALAVELGHIPVVPPENNRKGPWNYDKELYKLRK